MRGGRYRHALFPLLLRTLAQRSRGSLFGALWLFLEPFLFFLLYTFVFGFLLKVRFDQEGGLASFSAYLLAGLIPFTAFQESLMRALPLLPAHRDLLLNTPFPALLLPLVEALASLVPEGIGLLLLLGYLALKGGASWSWLLLPLLVAVRLLLSLGAAWLFSALYPFLRDLEPILRMGLTGLLFLTPILYPPELLPEGLLFWQGLNPLFWLVEGYRSLLLEGALPPIGFWLLAGALLPFTLLAALFFQKAAARCRDLL